MTLNELQKRSWEIAEKQGHHDSLNKLTVTNREAALSVATANYDAITTIVQQIKRHGLTATTLPHIQDGIDDAIDTLQRFGDICTMLVRDNPPIFNTLELVTAYRLAFAHTEISEATQEVRQYDVTPNSLGNIAHEVVDTIIRLTEMLYDITSRLDYPPVDLDAVAEWVSTANEYHPYKYGTPEEQRP